MINGTEKYIGTVNYLSRLYDYCNAKLFDGELTKPVITVQRDERNKAFGWWSKKKVWHESDENEGDGSHELNIVAQELNRPIKEIAATMIHEMCHQYASVHNLQDTSRSGNYHNKVFKRIAEAHGLAVECVRLMGWSVTSLTLETSALITDFEQLNPPDIIYRLPVFKGESVKSSSTRKYVCPVCGTSVRATKEVHIQCVDCNQLMQEE